MRGLYIILLAILSIVLQVTANAQQPKWQPSPHIAPTEALSPNDAIKKLHVPKGFEIQLVAAEPDIMNPININFDAKGRLWVAMSSEYPFPSNKKKTKDTVKILEDFGPDGRARKITTFADNLNIPIGVLPIGKGAIIYSIPNIWYMEDTDGDGKADRKEKLLQSYGHRDTHGMTGEFQFAFDGWVYACHGFSNTSTVRGKDGSNITMTSGNTYRFKPDGTKVEYFTHGQVNPFGIAFDPLFNLFTCDCHTRPIYQILRGAYYPSFGKPHDGIGFGPEMMRHSHGSTAIAGIAYYSADHYPKAYQDNIFIGNVVTNRVNRDSLIRHGSTLLAKEQPDFVRSDDRWFRPVDVKLGPDGSLFICDFYNRIIGHYEVPLNHPGRDFTHGRIWRVVYKGNKDNQKPPIAKDWTKATTAELAQALGHPNLAVRLFATHLLTDRGGDDVLQAVTKVTKMPDDPLQYIHGLWVMQRLGKLTPEILRTAAVDKHAGVRTHAMKILAERQKWSPELRVLAVTGLQDGDAFVKRAAAQALGEHADAKNLPVLLKLRYAVPAEDTHLLHVVRMAIRDQLKSPQVWKDVAGLDLSTGHKLELADLSMSLRNQGAIAFMHKQLAGLSKERNRLANFTKHVVRFDADKKIGDEVMKLSKTMFAGDALGQAQMFRAIEQGLQQRGQPISASLKTWARDLSLELIAAKEEKKIVVGCDLAGDQRVKGAVANLTDRLGKKNPNSVRIASAQALLQIAPEEFSKKVGGLLSDVSQSIAFREQLADAMGRNNHKESRDQLAKAIATAPARLQVRIAVAMAGSRDGADTLLKTVKAGKASARLLRDRVVQQRIRQANPPGWQQRLANLTKGLPDANAALLKLLVQRRQGFLKANPEPKRGKMVFTKHCAACHQIDNEGGKIAPQLDGVGFRGTDRLLEDILDPNRNVDQAFRSTTLMLKNGQVISGLLVRKEGKQLIMADAKGKEKAYNQDDVDQRFVTQLSPMPANWVDQIPERELYDLLAFLLEQRKTGK